MTDRPTDDIQTEQPTNRQRTHREVSLQTSMQNVLGTFVKIVIARRRERVVDLSLMYSKIVLIPFIAHLYLSYSRFNIQKFCKINVYLLT